MNQKKKASSTHNALDAFTILWSDTVENPNVNISRNNGRQSKRNTDAEEILVLNLISLTTQDADTGDIGRCTDGCTVAAKGCAA